MRDPSALVLGLCVGLSVASLAACSSKSSADDTPADSGADSASDGAAPDASPAPIVAPNDQWTWVDFPDALCGNGTPTGIGINPHAGATRLLLFLQGGGECHDGPSCWTSSTASNISSGYTKLDFAMEPTLLLSPFQRGTGVPFGDNAMVFVPYCTGDLHIGTSMVTYDVDGAEKPTYFYGGHNLNAYLARLVLTFPSLERVDLLGVSAGGFGSFLNQALVAQAFGAPVDVIDDSGPAIDNALLGVPTQWGPQLPPGCTDCLSPANIFAFDRKTFPETRYGFLTYQTDTELPMFYGESDQAFAAQITQFIASLKPDPNARYFEVLSSGHVVFLPTDPTAAPFIDPWVTQLASGDPAWADEKH